MFDDHGSVCRPEIGRFSSRSPPKPWRLAPRPGLGVPDPFAGRGLLRLSRRRPQTRRREARDSPIRIAAGNRKSGPRAPRSFSGEPRYQRPPRYRPISGQFAAETSAPAGSPAPPSSAPDTKSNFLPTGPMAASNKAAPRSPHHPHTERRGISGVRISGFRGSLRGGQFARRSPNRLTCRQIARGGVSLQANRKSANLREDRPTKAPPWLASRNPEIPKPLCVRIAPGKGQLAAKSAAPNVPESGLSEFLILGSAQRPQKRQPDALAPAAVLGRNSPRDGFRRRRETRRGARSLGGQRDPSRAVEVGRLSGRSPPIPRRRGAELRVSFPAEEANDDAGASGALKGNIIAAHAVAGIPDSR